MKRRIIALLMATFSAAALLTSCDKDGGVNCSNHTDANKDAICDSCNRAIVTIVEQTPPEAEERVPMVVNPIPTDAKRSDYIVEKVQEPDVLPTSGWKKTSLLTTTEGSDEYVIMGFENVDYVLQKLQTKAADEEKGTPAKYKNVWSVVKGYGYTNQVVYSVTSQEYEDGTELETGVVEADWAQDDASIFHLAVTTASLYNGGTTKYVYFSIYGDKLLEADQEFRVSDIGVYGNYHYIRIGMDVYVIDAETNAYVTKMDADSLIKRPDYDYVVGDYGYVFNEDYKIWVYNLNGEKWIDCVYYKDMYSSSYFNFIAAPMQNGNILVQYVKMISTNAASYDYIDEMGSKYDIVQLIIDVKTGEEKEVEFGYLINSFTIATEEDGYTEAAKNVANITPIENDALNTNAMMENVILDNELNILYVYQPKLIGQDDTEKRMVGNDLYLTKIVYDEESYTRVLVNGAGDLVSYVPATYIDCGSYATSEDGTKYYAWTDLKNAKFELTEEFEFVYNNGIGYSIVKKTVTVEGEEDVVSYLRLDKQTLALTEIKEEIYTRSPYFYVCKVTETEDGQEVQKYKYYNAKGVLIGTYDNGNGDVRNKGDYIELRVNGETYFIENTGYSIYNIE